MSVLRRSATDSVAAMRRLVLIADERDDDRAALSRLLEDGGFEVVEATTGDEALAIARTAFPSLVILEVALPGMSGYEVCRVLREDVGGGLPILFVSGTRTAACDRVAGLSLGGDDYVVKPYAPDELLARVRRLLERSIHRPTLASRLTPRELEVLRLLADGLSPDEIAALLFISPRTVGTHVDHILTKLNVKSRVQAVAVAYRDGLVEALA
jgi:DNA-binding NarL/FixJ family response regulator